jgi:nitroreductase
MDLDKAIKTRKSVRRFTTEDVDWRDVIKAIDVARFAPMAGGIFSLRFIFVHDEKKIKRLAEASQQDFVGKASYVIVVVSDDSKVVRSYGKERGEKFARQQAGAAMQNFWLKLTEMGLATCWVGYFDDNIVRDVLQIPDEIIVEAMFPIGEETKIKTPEKKKADLENYIYFNKWKQSFWEPRTIVSHKAM